MRRHILAILILLLPAFSLMLRSGIYTMHDFHVFRLQQFGKCISEGQFPCRWAKDAGMGYGEPVFNFYGQFPYWLGQVWVTMGWQVIDATKILFILSMVLSAISMYYLAREYWSKSGAVLAALVYVYAPYRAVDVWVRAALPESLAFVLFPFIFLHFDQLILNPNQKNFFWLTVSLAALVTTHNLSALMLVPFMVAWWLYRAITTRSRSGLVWLVWSGMIALWLSAYYLLPVISESRFITVSDTTQGYYDYRAHFATLRQLFLDRSWGFGASLWGPVDDLSLSVGQMQWVLAAIAVIGYLRHKSKKVFFFAGLGLLAVFLTHGRSQPIWQIFPFMAFIQFPWRFLGLATFFWALASGVIVNVLSRRIYLAVLIVVAILINYSFFRPDIWRDISDTQQFSGELWDEQRASALQDFWPVFGQKMPDSYAPDSPVILLQTTEYIKVQYPTVYFPGWTAIVDGQKIDTFPEGELGLVTVRIPNDYSKTELRFENTWPRTVGNWLSIVTLIGLTAWYRSKKPLS